MIFGCASKISPKLIHFSFVFFALKDGAIYIVPRWGFMMIPYVPFQILDENLFTTVLC